ncbi:MAG TPA: recombinase RecT [Thermoplasmata archaeon]|nr:recombinase RecT [Thermoplasmata archaeon]
MSGTTETDKETSQETNGFRTGLDLLNEQQAASAAVSPEAALNPKATGAPVPWRPPEPFSERWKNLVLDVVDPNRSAQPADVAWFFYRCHRLGLDPLAEQAHFLWIRGRPKFYVGIHGARTLAEKTGERGGEAVVEILREKDALVGVTMRVERVRWHGDRFQVTPYTATARLNEYRPKRDFKPGDPWLDKPELMLEKCAAMLAYRKAFPEVLGDIYVREELDSAEDRT